MNINAVKYSPFMKSHAIHLFHALRDRILLPTDALKGLRFNSDDRVLWILESNSTEAQFIEDPGFLAGHALIEAAKSDYWYAAEKDYADDEDYGDEDYEVEE
jgi:hypothetical protein